MSLVNRAVVVAALASLAGAVGCNDRVDQCNKLIGAVNDATSAIDKANPGGAPTAEKMGAAAKALEGMKAAIVAVQLKDEKLKSFQTDYVNLVGKAAGAAKSLQGAIEKQDKDLAEGAVKDFKAADKDEDSIREAITNYCRGS